MNVDLSRPVPSRGGGDAPSDRRLRVIPGGLPEASPGVDSAPRRPRPFSLEDASSSLQTGPLSLLIIDDHAMFRQSLSTVIRQIAPHATIAEAGTCAEALDLLGSGCPFSIILLDLHFQTGPTGLLALDVIRERCAAAPIAVVSGHDDTDTMLGAIDHGAMGFIPKTSTLEILLHAMALVLAGQSYFPIDAVRRGLARAPLPVTPSGAAPPCPDGIAGWNLTPRENDVLALILHGKANKVIASELGIHNEDTVRKHVSSILRKASVRTRTQLVLKWFELAHGR